MRNIAILCLLLACALPALAGTYRADEIPNVQRMDVHKGLIAAIRTQRLRTHKIYMLNVFP